jgi:hypothetical protein
MSATTTSKKKPGEAKAARRSANAKQVPRRQMTVALAEKRAVGNGRYPQFDGVAFLRSLR